METKSLKERMKTYENKTYLERGIPVILRLKFKGINNKEVIEEVVKKLNSEIRGCRLAFIKSDEVNLVLRDKEFKPAYANYEVQKICSLLSSRFTFLVCKHLSEKCIISEDNNITATTYCFNIPRNETINYLINRDNIVNEDIPTIIYYDYELNETKIVNDNILNIREDINAIL